MNLRFLAALIVLSLFAVTMVTGCTTQSSQSPSSSASPSTVQGVTAGNSTLPIFNVNASNTNPSPSPQNMSAYLDQQLKNMGYTILAPLEKSVNTYGNDEYTGSVAEGQYNYDVRIEMTKSVYETQARFNDYVNYYLDEGYNTTKTTPASWSGHDEEGYVAYVFLDTNNLQVMEIYQ